MIETEPWSHIKGVTREIIGEWVDIRCIRELPAHKSRKTTEKYEIESSLDSVLKREAVSEDVGVLADRNTYEMDYSYNTKLELYTNLVSDIPVLCEFQISAFSTSNYLGSKLTF